MNPFLANKQIILGVTGGIAAYKSPDLVRRLREVGAKVRVVMTESAKQFITPLTLQAVSGNAVHDDLFDLEAENAMGHIELARWADLIVIAPATADFIGKMVNGEANDLLTTLCLATPSPIAVAPAMNQGMWKNTFTQSNVQALKAKHIHIFGPAEGNQACGDIGPGRMLEPLEIIDRISEIFATGSLSGKRVLITAGPTREALDPVRYISNGSSGKMGFALAEAAVEAGAQVTLISGPVNLNRPSSVEYVDVVSAQDMLDAVMAKIENCDIFFSVAAVADYRCQTISPQKTAKQAVLNLTLERTPDIVASVAKLNKKPFIVGFAAETENVLQNAKNKMKNKNLDMIIANQVGEGVGMGSENNSVTVLWEDQQQEFPLMPKRKLARELIELVSQREVQHVK
jgi:phosphopantothenoylcysteine decarboxylase/phosphopantothenate--cysteine ligase